MYPISQSKTGSGTCTAIFPDIYQNPFQMGIGVQLLTGGGVTTAIIAIEHSFDYRVVMAPSFNGLTALLDGVIQTAAWFPNAGTITAGAAGTTFTATLGTAGVTAAFNYAFPVAAVRANVISATATSFVIVNFLQATNAP